MRVIKIEADRCLTPHFYLVEANKNDGTPIELGVELYSDAEEICPKKIQGKAWIIGQDCSERKIEISREEHGSSILNQTEKVKLIAHWYLHKMAADEEKMAATEDESQKPKRQNEIVIEVEPFVKNGELFYKVTKLKALKKDRLPQLYLSGYPKVWLTESGALAFDHDPRSGYRVIAVNEIHRPVAIDIVLAICRRAGERLARINRFLKQESLSETEPGKKVFRI